MLLQLLEVGFCQNGVQKLCVSTFGFGISVESPIHEPSFTGFYVKSSYHYKKVNNVKFREIKSGAVLSIAAGGTQCGKTHTLQFLIRVQC